MRIGFNRYWLAAIVVGMAQTAALGAMIWDRAVLLAYGTEITLAVEPVDPRSLFRGDYVILSYAFSRLPIKLRQGPAAAARDGGATNYVTLARDADGRWQARRITRHMPTARGSDEIVLRGRDQRHRGPDDSLGNGNTTIELTYGIERYFLPEGRGHDVEKAMRDKRVEAVVAVGADGEAILKGLKIDGKLRFKEGLF